MNNLAPTINLYGINIDLSAILTITLTCIIVFIIAKLATRNLSVDKPSKMQNFMEWVVEFVRDIISNSMDMKKGKAFVALGMTLIMFVFVGNLLGMPLPIISEHEKLPTFMGFDLVDEAELVAEDGSQKKVYLEWLKSPTSDASVTLGLAFLMVFLSHYLGLTRNTKNYLKGFVSPFPVFLPINIIGEISKILTLGMRLFGNIFAGGVMTSTFLMIGAASVLGLVPWMGFSLFVGSIQAFIFTVLSVVYISQQYGGIED